MLCVLLILVSDYLILVKWFMNFCMLNDKLYEVFGVVVLDWCEVLWLCLVGGMLMILGGVV